MFKITSEPYLKSKKYGILGCAKVKLWCYERVSTRIKIYEIKIEQSFWKRCYEWYVVAYDLEIEAGGS